MVQYENTQLLAAGAGAGVAEVLAAGAGAGVVQVVLIKIVDWPGGFVVFAGQLVQT